MKKLNGNLFFSRRSDFKFYRALKLTILYNESKGKINPKTKKRYTSLDIVDKYDPQYKDSQSKKGKIWTDTGGFFGEKDRQYYQPNKTLNQYENKSEVKGLKEWLKTIKLKGIITGTELRRYNLLKAIGREKKEEILDLWSKKYGITSGDKFRKIISEARKKFPKWFDTTV